MKFLQVTFIAASLGIASNAQNVVAQDEDIPNADEVQKAIDEFNRLRGEQRTEANEVTVVLDPPAVETDQKPEGADENLEPEPPALTDGKPLDTVEEIPDSPPEIAGDPMESGPNVRVQSIRKGSGEIDPDKITLRASFPVKPLSDAPEGWIITPSENAPKLSQTVEIHPGTSISLSITPYILSPDADGINTFSVSEPGYDPKNSYTQEKTVGAILGKSIEQLDQDSVKMGNIISDLHQLLASLPKPPTPEKPAKKP